MAVYTYTSDNIDFSTFDVWSNTAYVEDTNINLGAAVTGIFPDFSLNDISVSGFYNRSLFYGNIISTGNGTVQVTYPYTSTPTGEQEQVRNVDYSVYSYIRLTAAATYPYTFSEWRTAPFGGGSQMGTSANLDLFVNSFITVENFYAYFV
jgi:hypothetical protein